MKCVAAFSMLCCALVTCSALALDPLAPELTSLAMAGPVDITAGPAPLTVTMQVTDDEDGLGFGILSLYNPDGNFVNTGFFTAEDVEPGGSAMSGTYIVPVEVPAHAIPGTWRIEVLLFDTTGHTQAYTTQPADFPGGDPTFVVVHNNPAQIDGTDDPELGRWTGSPPQLVSFEAVPPVVAAGEPLTLRVRITDGLSGFSDGSLYFYNPQGEYQDGLFVSFDGNTTLVPDGGDALDGVYEIEIEAPEEAVPGLWSVEFFLGDFAGNKAFRDGGNFTVSSGGTTPSSLGNAVDAVQYPWTTSGPEAWTYQTEVSHDGVDAARSGPAPDNGESVMETYITGPGTLTFWWRVDSDAGFDVLWFEDLTGNDSRNISGDTGWIQETVTLGAGPNHLRWTYAKSPSDAVGQDCGWVDQVRFVADGVDLEPPALQGLEITPDPVDIEAGSQWVTFAITATDDFNGIVGGNLRVFLPDDEEFISMSFDESSRTEGDFRGGTFTLMAMVPQGSAPGTWRAEVDLFEGNSTTVVVYKPGVRGFPNPGEEHFVVSDGTSLDTVAPVVTEAQVNPDLVDITSGPGTLTVTLEIQDEGGSGFSEGSVDIYIAAERWTGSTPFNATHRQPGGDEHSGTYVVEVPVVAYGPPGTWTVAASVQDASGNQRLYSPFISQPNPLPEESTFQVVNAGPVDSTAPDLTSIDISPVAVDITDGAKDITITVNIAEDLSGLRTALVFFFNPGGQLDESFTRNLLDHEVGEGIYEVTVSIPQGAPTGQWELRAVLSDHTGLEARYGTGGEPYPQGVADGRFSVSTGGGTGSTYEQFALLYSLSGDDALPTADPDGDGFNNATELLLGTHPGNPASNGIGKLTVTRDTTHLHLNFTIDATLETGTDGVFLVLGDGTPRFRVTGQVQGGLGAAWNSVLPVHVSGQTYRVSVPLAGAPAGFVRLFFEEG